MTPTRSLWLAVFVTAVVLSGVVVLAQSPGDPFEPPLPRPPGLPPEDEERKEKKEDEPPTKPLIPESDREWGLPREILEKLALAADTYRAYALRFACKETVRAAEYDASGEASKERVRLYEYILERSSESNELRESRQKIRKSGKIEAGASTKDEEPFPPAYGWTALFSRFHQPYFAYRDLGHDFAGFDWVKVIQFKGSVPWSDGKDIRQWEGIAVMNAVDFTPIEIRAEPASQQDRIQAKFDAWARAFKIIGIHLAEKPLGYRCRVQFHMRRDGLTFPTELRYDTFRAVSAKRNVPIHASIRQYDDYRFFETSTSEQPGGPVAGSGAE